MEKNNEKFDPELFKVFQESEKSKEADWEKLKGKLEKKYPIGGYAPGNYMRKCCTCMRPFTGDKRAVQCESCAVSDKEMFDALSPSEQDELMNRNAEAIKEAFKDWRTFTTEPILSDEDVMAWEEDRQAPTSAVWVKASTWPEGQHNDVHWRRVADRRPLLVIGRNYQGNIVAQFGKVYTPDDLEWLDESR